MPDGSALLDSEAAWEAFIAEHEGAIRAYLRRRLPDDATADDLTQDTFVAFYTSLANFDPTRPAGPWLRQIAANKLTDWLRRQGRRPALPIDFSAGEGREPSARGRAVSSLARSVERRGEEEQAIAGALRSLLSEWRARQAWDRLAVAELTLLAGWTNQAAARRLAISEQSVANHKSYALGQVRSQLAAAGVGNLPSTTTAD